MKYIIVLLACFVFVGCQGLREQPIMYGDVAAINTEAELTSEDEAEIEDKIAELDRKITECNTNPDKVVSDQSKIYDDHVRAVGGKDTSFGKFILSFKQKMLDKPSVKVAEIKADTEKEKAYWVSVLNDPNNISEEPIVVEK